ncbi:hypothetical protein [Saccharopolyspora pogona]|uniref:hypothetical protein n=1 Tax=Saccharopolyspora pogona TaxID=333966 RepID=UPI001684DC58|nr:hypothetical protein [Saccharopolyspora pogona]
MVKKIPHEQSRRNATRRRRRVAARHARAGHWGAQSAPMPTSGKVSSEVGGNIDATCFGGIAALHRLVVKLGLVDRINDDLELLKVHLPYHESDHVLNLAYNVAGGGTRLAPNTDQSATTTANPAHQRAFTHPPTHPTSGTNKINTATAALPRPTRLFED